VFDGNLRNTVNVGTYKKCWQVFGHIRLHLDCKKRFQRENVLVGGLMGLFFKIRGRPWVFTYDAKMKEPFRYCAKHNRQNANKLDFKDNCARLDGPASVYHKSFGSLTEVYLFAHCYACALPNNVRHSIEVIKRDIM
jgi:hypothetical protein